MLCLKDGQGAIHHGGVADLIVIEEGAGSPAGAFEQLQIEMVMVAGRVQLASERVLDRMGPIPRLNHSIELEGRGQWFTRVDVPALYRQTASVLGPDFRLAGKRVAYRGALE
jgi:hypothetical protein